MTTGELRVDHEAIAAVAGELAAIVAALDAVVAYAGEDDLGAAAFGVLGEQVGAGAAFVQVRDALRESFAKAVPLLDEVARSVEDSAKDAAAADDEAAALIKRAGGDLA